MVVAVFKDFGASLFPSEDLALLQVHANEPLSWGSIGGTTCFVRSDEPEDKLTADIDAVLEAHLRKSWGRDETRVMKNGSIERMDRLYFSDLNNQRCLMKGNRSLLRMLSAVVLLLLLSAIFNYINLSSAASLVRRRSRLNGPILKNPSSSPSPAPFSRFFWLMPSGRYLPIMSTGMTLLRPLPFPLPGTGTLEWWRRSSA